MKERTIRQHPRSAHMRMVAAVNNVGMCSHLLAQINKVMADNLVALKEHRAGFVDGTPEVLEIDTFVHQAERLTEHLSLSELYVPDCGSTLAALLAKLPEEEPARGGI